MKEDKSMKLEQTKKATKSIQKLKRMASDESTDDALTINYLFDSVVEDIEVRSVFQAAPRRTAFFDKVIKGLIKKNSIPAELEELIVLEYKPESFLYGLGVIEGKLAVPFCYFEDIGLGVVAIQYKGQTHFFKLSDITDGM